MLTVLLVGMKTSSCLECYLQLLPAALVWFFYLSDHHSELSTISIISEVIIVIWGRSGWSSDVSCEWAGCLFQAYLCIASIGDWTMSCAMIAHACYQRWSVGFTFDQGWNVSALIWGIFWSSLFRVFLWLLWFSPSSMVSWIQSVKYN